MSTVVKKTVHFKINGKEASAPEGIVIKDKNVESTTVLAILSTIFLGE